MLEEIIKQIIALQQKRLSALTSGYLPTHVVTSWNDASPVELINDVKTHFLTSSQKVLLLIGEPGLGKTRSCQELALELLHHWQPGLPIPLYIPLATLQNPAKRLIEETLERLAVDLKWLPELKRTQRFLLILDGYDELTFAHNLYVSNELETWQAQVIISCRWQFLKEQGYRRCFAPQEKDTKKYQEALVTERILVPLPLETINNHLQAYVERLPELIVNNMDSYQAYLNRHPELKSCMAYPFLWQPILNALAEVIKNSSSAVDSTGTMLLPQETEEAIYKRVLEAWFKRQAEKTKKLAVDDCWSYAIVLATRWQHAEPLSEEEVDLLFASREARVKLAKLACPLRKHGSTYAFITPAFGQYLASQPMTEVIKVFIATLDPEQVLQWPHQALVSEESRYNQWLSQCLQDPRNLKPFDAVVEAGILNQDKDRVHTEEGYKDSLFEIVKFSRCEPPSEVVNTAAARAITILNYASVPFSGMDLSHIRISNADLSGAILDHVNLSNSILTNVFLTRTFLKAADLRFSRMKNVEFNEFPYLLDINMRASVTCLCYSANGKQLVAGSSDNKIQVWDWELGELETIFEIRSKKISDLDLSSSNNIFAETIKKHDDRITSLSISPTNKLLAASNDKIIYLWDLETNLLITELGAHMAQIMSVCFSPDSKYLASAGKDGFVILWDVQLKNIYQTLKIDKSWECKILFSFDAKQLFYFTGNTVSQLSIDSNECIKFLQFDRTISTICLSPDNKLLAVVCQGYPNYIRIWNIHLKLWQWSLKGHSEKITCLSFSFDSEWLASGSYDKSIRIWDMRTGMLIDVLQGHLNHIEDIAFNPKNKLILASGGWEGVIRLWRLLSYNIFKLLKLSHSSWAASINFSSDDKLLAFVEEKKVCLLNMRPISTRHVLREFNENINSIKFSPNNLMIAVGDQDSLYLIEVNSGQIIFEKKLGIINDVCFSSDSNYLASAGEKICLWSVESGNLRRTFIGHSDYIWSIDINGLKLASGSGDKTIRVWDIITGSSYNILQGHTDWVRTVCFNQEGTILASGSHDKTIRIWSMITNSLLHTLTGHISRVTSVCFSLDSQMFASGSMDGVVIFWNIQTGEQILNLNGHGTFIRSVQFNKYNLLATAGDTTTKVWQKLKSFNSSHEWCLIWSSQRSLYAQECKLDEAIIPNINNQRLLKQRGSTGEPAKITSNEEINRYSLFSTHNKEASINNAHLTMAIKKTF